MKRLKAEDPGLAKGLTCAELVKKKKKQKVTDGQRDQNHVRITSGPQGPREPVFPRWSISAGQVSQGREIFSVPQSDMTKRFT